MRELFHEIKRRNVFRVALVYIIAGWLTMQIVDVMFPALNLPDWMVSAVAALLLVGFPFALIFAWAFELTPDGIKREKDVDRSQSITAQTGRKLNQSALIILAIAVTFLLVDKFFLRQGAESEAMPQAAGNVDGAGEISETDAAPSIAVLPFVNMSADTENEYFSDGLSEELLNVLARIPQLRVAGRTSSFAFKGKNEDLRTIGDALNVGHILEGSVRRSNTRLRITAQLIDTENGFHLWSETYDRELDDVFEIQDEIANAVADALRLTLLGGASSERHGTDSLQAFELLLRARYYYNHGNEENLNKSIDALNDAVRLDPDYADAWALLADAYAAYISGWVSSGDDFEEGFRQVREYANRAVAADPRSAAAQIALGMSLATADWRIAEGKRHFEKAVELEPSNVDALLWLAQINVLQGHFEESRTYSRRALEIDPLAVGATRLYGDALMFEKDYAAGIAVYEEALGKTPELARFHGRAARGYIALGDYEKALEHARAEPVEWVRELLEILVMVQTAEEVEWRAAAEAYSDKWGTANAYQMAEIYGSADDHELAYQWLATCRDVHDPGTPWSRVSFHLDPIKDDPRWPEHLAAVGLAD